jgi:hypothetical protein
MRGTLWALDTPYFAITDKDGNFEIKDVPVGDVQVVTWHEGLPKGGWVDTNAGKKVALKPGKENDLGETKIKP